MEAERNQGRVLNRQEMTLLNAVTSPHRRLPGTLHCGACVSVCVCVRVGARAIHPHCILFHGTLSSVPILNRQTFKALPA